jgi:hypothetical protein
MRRRPMAMAWTGWTITFLCACTTAVPRFEAEGHQPKVIVVRPAGYRPVELSDRELKEGMRMLWSRGPLPGAPRPEQPRFRLAKGDAEMLQKAADYLQFCEGMTGARTDCWGVLGPAGLDAEGSLELALRFAFGEALRDAAAAVGSITPEQVRAILAVTLIGAILGLLDPNPWTKALSMVASANLVAYVGVDLCNTVVDGYVAMATELNGAHSFASIRRAGENYGKRLGPMVARLVLMAATYGAAKAAGLFTGSSISLPGGQRAAALAEAQGFNLPAAEGARAITLNADGSVAIQLGATVSVGSTAAEPPRDGKAIEILRPGGRLIGEPGSGPSIRILHGGKAEAEALFQQLAEGGEVVGGTTYPGTRVRLPEGGFVGLRLVSTSGPITIDVEIPGVGVDKIKFLP